MLSHALQTLGKQLEALKTALKERTDKTVAVCLDIMGPEIRTGPHKDGKPIELKKDSVLKISIDPELEIEGDSEGIGCNYEKLLEHTKIGKVIFIQDGAVVGQVIEKGDVSAKIFNAIRTTSKSELQRTRSWIRRRTSHCPARPSTCRL